MTALNLRQQMIVDVQKEIGANATFAEIEAALPPDFELSQLDLDELPPPVIDAEFTLVELGDGSVAANAATEMAPEPEHEPTTIEEAERAVVLANDALSNARNDVNRCARVEREANAKLAREIKNWQSGFPIYTPEMLRRDHIENELNTRKRIANGELPMAEVAAGFRSTVDRQRAWARSGGPDSGQGNPGRAVVEGQRVYPQSLRGAVIPKPTLR